MDYARALAAAAKRHSRARAKLAEAEAARDQLVRAAHTDGGMSTREIAPLVGMSYQRVGQIVKPAREQR